MVYTVQYAYSVVQYIVYSVHCTVCVQYCNNYTVPVLAVRLADFFLCELDPGIKPFQYTERSYLTSVRSCSNAPKKSPLVAYIFKI